MFLFPLHAQRVIGGRQVLGPRPIGAEIGAELIPNRREVGEIDGGAVANVECDQSRFGNIQGLIELRLPNELSGFGVEPYIEQIEPGAARRTRRTAGRPAGAPMSAFSPGAPS